MTRNIVAVLPKDLNSSNFVEIEILKVNVNLNERDLLNKEGMKSSTARCHHGLSETENTASQAVNWVLELG